MNTRRTIISGIWGLVCFSIVGAGVSVTREASARDDAELLAVVVAKDSSLRELSSYQLKQIYLGEAMRTPGGDRFVPLNRGAKTPERMGFDRSVLGLSPEEASRYWIDRRIRGRSGSPKAVDPANLVQKLVERLPGAIAYVRESEVSSDVRVIAIDGKLPGQPGYLVRSSAQSMGAMAGSN